MHKTQKSIVIVLFILVGIIISFLINSLIIDNILIPDICKYHFEEPNWLISLLFTFDSSDGGHPFPSTFHLIMNLILGLLIGLFIYRKSIRNKTKKSTSD